MRLAIVAVVAMALSACAASPQPLSDTYVQAAAAGSPSETLSAGFVNSETGLPDLSGDGGLSASVSATASPQARAPAGSTASGRIDTGRWLAAPALSAAWRI